MAFIGQAKTKLDARNVADGFYETNVYWPCFHCRHFGPLRGRLCTLRTTGGALQRSRMQEPEK